MAIINRAQPKFDILGFIKANLGMIILVAYIVFSLAFIAKSFYVNALSVVYNNGAQTGYQQAVFQLVEEVQKSGCTPTSVRYGEGKEMKILNAVCANGGETTTPATPATK